MKRTIKRLKLAFLWVTRIVMAPNHFGVSVWTRLQYSIVGGFVADQYVLYDLAHRSRSDYLSEFDWYRSRWINEPFDAMLNNKVVCAEVLKEHAFVPETLFIKNKGRYLSPANPSRLSSLEAAIATVEHQNAVFMKPIGAGKGKGVHRIEAADPSMDRRYLIDGRSALRSDVEDLLRSEDGWFFSECIAQHPVLDAIYDKTTNTIRLITLRDPKSGEFKVFFAVLRIGTAKTIPVDNGSRGGLVAKIDLDTGELSEARSLWTRSSHRNHPDSGALIEGASIPEWRELKQAMLNLAQTFPYLQFIAWDVLISPQGPCVIEANTSSGVNIIQLWGPQRRGELGDFYRAHKVIK